MTAGPVPRLASIQVGRPKLVDGLEPWTTAMFKAPVEGPVMLRRTHLDGDEQGDLSAHGGPDRAVCVYSADHYAWWRESAGISAVGFGAFGENFSVAGQIEADVCIGDRYVVGDALVEVSQPRTPCWKVARRWKIPELPRLVLKSGRTGWFLRVVAEGVVSAGRELELVARPFPEWTIERVSELTFGVEPDGRDLERLKDCDVLAAAWRRSLQRRLFVRS